MADKATYLQLLEHGKQIDFLLNSPEIEDDEKKELVYIWDSLKSREESKFDAFTSIFGAGPAYISYLANLLSEIAKSNGFDNPEPWIGDLLGGTFEMHKSDESPSFNDIKGALDSSFLIIL